MLQLQKIEMTSNYKVGRLASDAFHGHIAFQIIIRPALERISDGVASPKLIEILRYVVS